MAQADLSNGRRFLTDQSKAHHPHLEIDEDSEDSSTVESSDEDAFSKLAAAAQRKKVNQLSSPNLSSNPPPEAPHLRPDSIQHRVSPSPHENASDHNNGSRPISIFENGLDDDVSVEPNHNGNSYHHSESTDASIPPHLKSKVNSQSPVPSIQDSKDPVLKSLVALAKVDYEMSSEMRRISKIRKEQTMKEQKTMKVMDSRLREITDRIGIQDPNPDITIANGSSNDSHTPPPYSNSNRSYPSPPNAENGSPPNPLHRHNDHNNPYLDSNQISASTAAIKESKREMAKVIKPNQLESTEYSSSEEEAVYGPAMHHNKGQTPDNARKEPKDQIPNNHHNKSTTPTERRGDVHIDQVSNPRDATDDTDDEEASEPMHELHEGSEQQMTLIKDRIFRMISQKQSVDDIRGTMEQYEALYQRTVGNDGMECDWNDIRDDDEDDENALEIAMKAQHYEMICYLLQSKNLSPVIDGKHIINQLVPAFNQHLVK